MNWKKQTISVLLPACILTSITAPATAISDEEVKAPTAILVEVKTGKVLYEENSHERRPAASITKVMILLLVMEAINSGKAALTDTVSASTHATSTGGSDIWLQQGEITSVSDLIKATVIMSANDAIVALVKHVAGTEDGFLYMMSNRVKELGMNDTTFRNCNGLNEDGHPTPTNDVALVSAELLRHEKVTECTLAWIDHVCGGEMQLVNTSKLIKNYKGTTGLKAGITGKAGSCVGTSTIRGRVSLVVVILGSSTTDDRLPSTVKLLDYGFANWSMATPEEPELQKIPVINSMQSSVEFETTDNPALLVLKGKESEVVSQIVVADSPEAPAKSGQIIDKVTYKLGDGMLLETDIRAKTTAEKMTFSSVFRLLCMGMICF